MGIRLQLLGAALVLLSACAPPASAPDDAPVPQALPTAADSVVPERIAREVVAARTGAALDRLELVSSEYREFSDSGLGCPVAGRAYLQVLTPGYQVLIRFEGQVFDVRVAGSRGRICDRPAAADAP
jgi:hypothetical protein